MADPRSGRRGGGGVNYHEQGRSTKCRLGGGGDGNGGVPIPQIERKWKSDNPAMTSEALQNP